MANNRRRDGADDSAPDGMNESGAQPAADHVNQYSVDRSTDADAISRRAYERFEERGQEHGHDQEDWFEAERDVRADRERSASE